MSKLTWLTYFWGVCSVLTACSPESTNGKICEKAYWEHYEGTKLYSLHPNGAYFYVTDHMSIDADGAPNAYGPKNSGLDYNANAGYPDQSWWRDVLVPDPSNSEEAYVQPHGEFAGYFVSKTALFDNRTSTPATSPKKYVNASEIPYVVFPGKHYLKKGTGRLGDFGYAVNLNSGVSSPFIVADVGPTSAKLGEVSIRLAENLGGENVSPRDGSGRPKGEILYVVFPYSSSSSREERWPLDNDEISRLANAAASAIGGIETLRSCNDH